MAITRLTGYDRALFELRAMTGDLALIVDQQLRSALNTLKQPTVNNDWSQLEEKIDAARDKIVNRCVEMMCLQQLRPQDLHWLLGFKRIAEALERVADYACDIAELNELEQERKWSPEIYQMAEHLLQMYQYVVEVLEDKRPMDLNLDDEDDVLDQAYCALKEELIKGSRDTSNINNKNLGLALVLARTIERMGDHIVNMAEMLVYVQTGQRKIDNALHLSKIGSMYR